MSVPLLSDLQVLEIAHPTTEYAGKILAEVGASVFLIEEPGGAATRARRPFAMGASKSRASIPFLARNADKRSAVFDPTDAADVEALCALAAASDAVLLPTDSPFAELLTEVEVPVRVELDDPEGIAAAGIVAFAASGGLSSSGWPQQPPCNAPSWLAIDGAGTYAAMLVAVGYRELLAGRRPAVARISVREAAVAALTPWTRPLHSQELEVSGQGIMSRRLGSAGMPTYRARDGYIRLLTTTPRQWTAFVELLGRPDAICGEAWDDPLFQRDNADAVRAVAEPLIRDRTRADLFENGQRIGLTITPVNSVAEVMDDRHVRERATFVPVSDPELGDLQLQREPYLLGAGTHSEPPRPAPTLGADNAEARRLADEPGSRRTGAHRTEAPRPSDDRRSLRGLRVLNLGVGAVVPEAAEQLALLGADVIKIESQRRLDFLRLLRVNESPPFNQLNLGVRSMAVDMTTERGREVVRKLVPLCDMVMENMRAPVVRNWGLDYESVRALRPDVIYFSSQGFGPGPYGDFQTFGPNVQAFSGVTASWAHPDDPFPVGTTLNHPDHLAGKQALIPILAALIHREQTGEGAHIECAQYEIATEFFADKFLQEQLLPGSVGPTGNRSPDVAPHGVYPCAGEDRWCAIAVTSEEQWNALQATVDEQWTDDPAFATVESRLEHAAELDAYVAAWTGVRSAEEVEAALRAAGVPVSRAVTGDDMAANDADHASGFFPALDHPTAGTHHYTGLPFTLDGKRVPSKRPPLLGEHTKSVLYDLLGLEGDEVAELLASGAVGY
jgi:crotonobetainyl-CoA:carnitine CoA-transferase CaiB-like acyl-CoA transferase